MIWAQNVTDLKMVMDGTHNGMTSILHYNVSISRGSYFISNGVANFNSLKSCRPNIHPPIVVRSPVLPASNGSYQFPYVKSFMNFTQERRGNSCSCLGTVITHEATKVLTDKTTKRHAKIAAAGKWGGLYRSDVSSVSYSLPVLQPMPVPSTELESPLRNHQ